MDWRTVESPLDRIKRLTEEAQARVVVFQRAMQRFICEKEGG